MPIHKIFLGVLLIVTFASCSKKNANQVATLQQAASHAAEALKAKDSSDSSSYSPNHCEYNQTSIIELTFDTKDDAKRISDSIKERFKESGYKILMYNSHATVQSGNVGWSGGLDSWMNDEYAGDEHGMTYGGASGDLSGVEKLFISSVIRSDDADILLHCRLFPEEHRVHFSATIIPRG